MICRPELPLLGHLRGFGHHLGLVRQHRAVLQKLGHFVSPVLLVEGFVFAPPGIEGRLLARDDLLLDSCRVAYGPRRSLRKSWLNRRARRPRAFV